MKRVEIITNLAISEDILEELEIRGLADSYTFLPCVHGRGNKGTRLGSPLWPEENCIYLLYLEDHAAEAVKEAVRTIKKRFPNEGTKCYISPAEAV